MFLSDNVPIIHDCPHVWTHTNAYFLHDLHFGSELFDSKRWGKLKNQIINDAHAIVFWVGDLIENAIPNSKSDVFTQTHSPAEQKEWATQQLTDLKDKTAAVVPGNHCSNRTTKVCGLYPLYDCCLIAGMGEKYRDTFAIIDVGIGRIKPSSNKQFHYVGQIQHKAKDIKACCSADFTDGIDFFAYGHDHNPKDNPRAKLIYDKHRKTISKRNVEVINCGSMCGYGGYGAREAYRPQSDKLYSLTLSGTERNIESRGFYV